MARAGDGMHGTGFGRNYDAKTETYSPKLAETDLGCKACHSPGAGHVACAKTRAMPPPPGLGPFGLTTDLTRADTEPDTCRTCHSRRKALQDGTPVPGTPYHGSFILSLLRPGTYHPDGQVPDEMFGGGSFLQTLSCRQGRYSGRRRASCAPIFPKPVCAWRASA